jgi:ketosteroid isomerase-like protein
MSDQSKDSEQALRETIDRYNAAWNDHNLDAIMAMHAPDMVFENHAAGESAQGEEARAHIGSIFTTWPDIAFTTRRLYVREGLVVQEWTAAATHPDDAPRRPRRRAERQAGRVGRPRRDPL